MNVLIVTGATGHIGSVLVHKLVERYRGVRALLLPGEGTEALDRLNVEVVRGDVTDYPSVFSAFSGVEYVFHVAGIVSIGRGMKAILDRVNVGGTRNIVEACLERGVKRLVYVSSIHAFREPPHGQHITETKEFDERLVVGDYAKSKAAATKIVLDAVRRGLDAVIVHPTGVIGPYDYRRSHMGQLVADFLSRRLLAYIDGSYDFVDVRDVAQGIILALEKGRRGENYILSGEQISVKQIIDALEEITGIKGPRVKIPLSLARLTAPLSELYYKMLRQKPLYTSYSIYTITSNSLTTSSKAGEELGYAARPIRQTLEDTVHWMQDKSMGGHDRVSYV